MQIEDKLQVVSLFAGIGGFDLGFKFAGFNVVWANDFDKYACQTYRANIGDIVEGDIVSAKKMIPKHDVLIGGFPCQSFSTLGNKLGFKEETRGNLLF
jgi:DNA (cytosine-5)-methyltransferase 1